MAAISHHQAWDGARNLADLGGLPLVGGGRTTSGRVFRSAAPEWMTSQGWDEARAAGVACVIDLRNDMERGRQGVHPVLEPGATDGVTVIHAPTEDPDDEQFLSECGPWLDHPRSWTANLRLFPDKIARVLTAVAEADGPVLIHCAGGRDRTGMVASMLLALAGATREAIVANYESGFRGAAVHRGHSWAFDPNAGEWTPAPERPWSESELDAALAERRPALREWLATCDPANYLLDAGVSPGDLATLARLLRA